MLLIGGGSLLVFIIEVSNPLHTHSRSTYTSQSGLCRAGGLIFFVIYHVGESGCFVQRLRDYGVEE